MYHANAWGVVYAATLVGAKLVLPGSKLDGESLVLGLRPEQVRLASAAGVSSGQGASDGRGANIGAGRVTLIEPLGSHPLHPVLSASVGRRIGFSSNEGSELRRDARHVLQNRDVYALHVGASDPATGGAVASAMVAITPKGCEVLVRSPE